jgi:S-adenosylmethionine:tRNA ribosyltransferase-isomerase
MFYTSEFDFNLPEKLIAQQPFFPKEETKLLAFCWQKIIDSKIKNLTDFLEEGDLLVFNDAKVIKAKLSAKILRNEAKVEFNLDQKIENKNIKQNIWKALIKPAKKVKQNDCLIISDNFSAEVIEKLENGEIKIKFNYDDQNLFLMLEKYGSIPLPPYIKREEKNEEDQKNYQTCYAKNGVAVAAPTAGLHFTEEMFLELERKKINKCFVTLNVGAGTFLPVKSEIITDHKMHQEFFSISQESADLINFAKENKKRVIAVGTTSLRVLESAADENGFLFKKSEDTKIFIYPSYRFKVVDGLITNFHLPKSTLFMLICAFVGKENAFKIYHHAIKNSYRFYSYGDASILIK